LDAKYYKSPLTNNEKFNSDHISQLILYPEAYNLYNGFLIYPETEKGKIDSKTY
jgi:5-methylcytosine-specific restriction endonuclease McrBC regulatory subunit McrC